MISCIFTKQIIFKYPNQSPDLCLPGLLPPRLARHLGHRSHRIAVPLLWQVRVHGPEVALQGEAAVGEEAGVAGGVVAGVERAEDVPREVLRDPGEKCVSK